MWPLIEALLPILALGGTVGGSIWLTGTIWEWWKPRRLSVQLRQMAPEIDLVQSKLRGHYDYGEPNPRALAMLIDDLWRRFGIKTPDLMTMEEWKDYLFALYRLARQGKVRDARRLRSSRMLTERAQLREE